MLLRTQISSNFDEGWRDKERERAREMDVGKGGGGENIDLIPAIV